MCWCSPNLRTPCCGGSDCHPPQGSTISNETLLQQSQLQLWQSYCDKKIECEILRDKLAEVLDMLEYSHMTSEVYYDHKMVSKFIKDTNKFMETLK